MGSKQRPAGTHKSYVLAGMPHACRDERAAVEFLEAQRWGGTPACSRCGVLSVYQMKDAKTGEHSARWLWRCHGCKRQFA
jgi:hypothetical protein